MSIEPRAESVFREGVRTEKSGVFSLGGGRVKGGERLVRLEVTGWRERSGEWGNAGGVGSGVGGWRGGRLRSRDLVASQPLSNMGCGVGREFMSEGKSVRRSVDRKLVRHNLFNQS